MRRLRSRRAWEGETEANPMEGLGNLADAMLVLAVGILLALIINWRVDITAAAVPERETRNEPVAIDEQDMTDTDTALSEEDLRRVGALYYDEETGMFYAIASEEASLRSASR